MAVKYLAGNRLWGTDAERLALTIENFSDSMGSSADATNDGATLDTGEKKLGTGSLAFDGTADNVNDTVAKTSMTTAGTIAFWFNTDDITDDEQNMVTFGNDGANEKFWIEIQSGGSGRVNCQMRHSSTSSSRWKVYTDDGSVSQDTWHHYAVTHNGTTPTCYIDGDNQTNFQITNDKTVWFSGMSAITNGRLGCVKWGSTSNERFFDGNLDDIGIWNRALTEAEVQSLYGSGSSPKLCSTIKDGLRVYYNCDSATVDNNAVPTTDTYPNLKNGTTFLTSDTNKLYMWNGTDTWNEVS